MFYKNVELFYDPERTCNQITKSMSGNYSEMSSFQKAFLCGLLKESQPRKVLEIGVAGGGTTATILTCLTMLDYSAEMYSVDVAEKWYRTGKIETGFVAKEFMEQIIGKTEHKFLLGKPIPYFIEAIKGGIDFLILDTTHVVPGELLDFLICFPFLRNGCIVVLHDMINNLLSGDNNSIATKLLFNLVQGNKWYMQEDNPDTMGFSNIAAFEVNEKTKEYIDSVFTSLSFTWAYALDKEDANAYTKQIRECYGIEYANYFEDIMQMQRYTQIKKDIDSHYHLSHEFLRMKWKKQKHVYLYGAGNWAKIYTEYATINSLPIEGYVISDDQEIPEENGRKIYKLADLPLKPEECSFVLALERRHFAQVRRNLANKGYCIVL